MSSFICWSQGAHRLRSHIFIASFVFHGLLFWKHPLVKDTGYKNAARFFSVKDNMFTYSYAA
jgi:hypothetical protein